MLNKHRHGYITRDHDNFPQTITITTYHVNIHSTHNSNSSELIKRRKFVKMAEKSYRNQDQLYQTVDQLIFPVILRRSNRMNKNEATLIVSGMKKWSRS